MQCKDVEFVVEQEGLAPLPEAARAHVAACSHCQEFVADLATIVSAANELPAEVEPPARVWVSLRAQLELEGIIKTPVVPASGERWSWWHGFDELFRSRVREWLAGNLRREEIPSWGTPTIVEASGHIELVTNATKFVRGYDPMTGKELYGKQRIDPAAGAFSSTGALPAGEDKRSHTASPSP